jgi:hypothetical protein
MTGDLFESRREVRIPVNELRDLPNELLLAPIVAGFRRQKNDVVLNQIIIRRERD